MEKLLAWCHKYFANLEKIDGVCLIYVEADGPAGVGNAILPITADSPDKREATQRPLARDVRYV